MPRDLQPRLHLVLSTIVKYERDTIFALYYVDTYYDLKLPIDIHDCMLRSSKNDQLVTRL